MGYCFDFLRFSNYDVRFMSIEDIAEVCILLLLSLIEVYNKSLAIDGSKVQNSPCLDLYCKRFSLTLRLVRLRSENLSIAVLWHGLLVFRPQKSPCNELF
jgi:hypothetical protein